MSHRVRKCHYPWPAVLFTCVMASLLSFACEQARNTPETACAQLKEALAQSRWDLLFELFPPDVQEEFNLQIQANSQRIRDRELVEGRMAASEALKESIGVSLAEWEKMSDADRFNAVFGVVGHQQLVSLGVNPDHIVSGEVISIEKRGDSATVILDDGRGHRIRVAFEVIDGLWRYDPRETP